MGENSLTLHLFDLVFFRSKSKNINMNIPNLLISAFLLCLYLYLYSCSAKTEKSSPPKMTEDCLNYEPQKVKLEGFLNKKSFPGPPNYQDIKKGDEEEVYWLIKTAKPFCVNKSSYVEGDELHGLSEVQLVVDELNFYNSNRRLLGKKVILTGTLFPQITGHHKTEVLITVETLKKAYE